MYSVFKICILTPGDTLPHWLSITPCSHNGRQQVCELQGGPSLEFPVFTLTDTRVFTDGPSVNLL